MPFKPILLHSIISLYFIPRKRLYFTSFRRRPIYLRKTRPAIPNRSQQRYQEPWSVCMYNSREALNRVHTVSIPAADSKGRDALALLMPPPTRWPLTPRRAFAFYLLSLARLCVLYAAGGFASAICSDEDLAICIIRFQLGVSSTWISAIRFAAIRCKCRGDVQVPLYLFVCWTWMGDDRVYVRDGSWFACIRRCSEFSVVIIQQWKFDI